MRARLADQGAPRARQGQQGGAYTIARTTRATAVLDAGTSRPSMARMVSPACRPARSATDAAATSGTCRRPALFSFSSSRLHCC